MFIVITHNYNVVDLKKKKKKLNKKRFYFTLDKHAWSNENWPKIKEASVKI